MASKRRKKKDFPTLDDIKKEAGPMGLLDPKLRKGVTGKIPSRKSLGI